METQPSVSAKPSVLLSTRSSALGSTLTSLVGVSGTSVVAPPLSTLGGSSVLSSMCSSAVAPPILILLQHLLWLSLPFERQEINCAEVEAPSR